MKFTCLHTHSTFSDGKSTVEEHILSAIEKGFASIGFTDHSYTFFDLAYCMMPDQYSAYRKTVLEMQKKYADRIDVFLGLELDGYSDAPDYPYDYIIGSLHYLYQKENGRYYAMDGDPAEQREAAEIFYGGSFEAMAAQFFRDSVECLRRRKPDIIGHFDLVTKHSLIHEDDAFYRHSLLEAVSAALEICPVFEINTGAIARGYRQTPYPADFVIRYIAEHGGKFTLSSDCHNAAMLDCHYPQSLELARACGVKSLVRLTKQGWIEEGI